MRLLLATAVLCTIGTIAVLAIVHLGPRAAGVGIAVTVALVWTVAATVAALRRGARATQRARRRALARGGR